MNKKQLIIAIALTLILFSGCRSIYVGGSGKVGDVSGSGGVSIPIPERK
ncbi:MAG: hypothetical protein L6404_02100 [Candidatus Omnitrophica bacterium]|nr:hypothetical protein [Candidatus Omnitrophota bacterium]